jgi:hypothetical protein
MVAAVQIIQIFWLLEKSIVSPQYKHMVESWGTGFLQCGQGFSIWKSNSSIDKPS